MIPETNVTVVTETIANDLLDCNSFSQIAFPDGICPVIFGYFLLSYSAIHFLPFQGSHLPAGMPKQHGGEL
jgi:hypothetical protein